MTTARSVFMCLLLASGIAYGEETVIHRCAQEDGTVAFQEIPCPEPVEQIDADEDDQPTSESGAPADDLLEFVNPFDEQDEVVARPEPESIAPPSLDRAECEKTTRDAIDAIDAELQGSDSQETDRKYLAKLLELTRQLRACKTL